jgi:excisionase family DNA binding protein
MAEQAEFVSPNPQEVKEMIAIYEKMFRMEAKLIGPDGKTQYLPNNLYSFLCQLLADLKAGKSVTLLQHHAVLTTVEAAKLLGMSRQFLIGLIDKGLIPHHMVGTHRRLYAGDVLTYKAQRDAQRRKILDDLSRSEKEQGLYDRMPDDFSSR